MWKKYKGEIIRRGNGLRGHFYDDETLTEVEVLRYYKRGIFWGYDCFLNIEIMVDPKDVVGMCDNYVDNNFYKCSGDKRKRY